jgi:tRNA pseudouridine38-40 synthase
MQRYFLELFFKGTAYSGWQKQKNAISVQQVVNSALGILLNGKNGIEQETLGCGRTDTGVHATQFFAHFDVKDAIPDIKNFKYQLNGILPGDITITHIHAVQNDAHARYDALSRTYQYFIHTTKNGFLSEFSACYFKKLNMQLMQEAADLLLHHHDFASFCKSRAQSKTSICHITRAKWSCGVDTLKFEITADRFLRGMVRALVGTMVEVGAEKISISEFKEIINARNRRKAGPAAPACGLYLTHIEYPYLKVENRFNFPFVI